MTRLQARISSLERAADRQNLAAYDHTLSLPALSEVTHTPDHSFAQSRPSSPKRLQAVHSPSRARSTLRQTCSSPPEHTDPQLTSVPYLSNQTESHQTSVYSIDSSLDLPLSLKATLREALHHQLWETSSISSFPDTVDRSWQGFNSTEVAATSDLSFNPLTYMMDKQEDGTVDSTLMQEADDEPRREPVCTLVGQSGEEERVDTGSLTGMLRFVNQTLAMQDDLSSWASASFSQSGHRISLQVSRRLVC